MGERLTVLEERQAGAVLHFLLCWEGGSRTLGEGMQTSSFTLGGTTKTSEGAVRKAKRFLARLDESSPALRGCFCAHVFPCTIPHSGGEVDYHKWGVTICVGSWKDGGVTVYP